MNTEGNKAFTLVESLVAIAILLIAVVGPLSIVAGSISTASLAKDQVTAYYLAQEGVEIIRNIRDTNYLSGNSWLQGLSGCIDSASNVCLIDPFTKVVTTKSRATCSSSSTYSDCALYKDTNYRFTYNTSGTTATSFQRLISLTTINSQEVRISVTINWMTGSYTRNFTISDNLYNWN